MYKYYKTESLQQKFRRKRGGKNKFGKTYRLWSGNLINIKLNHRNNFWEVSEHINNQ